jgi:hypothetical protein
MFYFKLVLFLNELYLPFKSQIDVGFSTPFPALRPQRTSSIVSPNPFPAWELAIHKIKKATKKKPKRKSSSEMEWQVTRKYL